MPSSAARPRACATLPHGAVVGTASLRRQAQVKRLRPDLSTVVLRGNVETRLRKLDAGEVDATLLALAGLKRLGLADEATALLDVDEFLPAVGQGAVTIEARIDDARTRELLAKIDHADTSVALACERAFLAVLDGSCRTPIAGHATLQGDRAEFPRHDPAAGRQRGVRDEPQRQPRRCGRARRGRGRRTEGARAVRFLRGLTCACSSRGRKPTRRAPRKRCARAGTRCWSRRCCAIESIDADFGGSVRRRADDQRECGARASRRIRAPASSRALPCLTVGDRSAEAARAAGFTRVESADGALADLVRLATQRHATAAAALSRGRGSRGRSRGRTGAPRHRGRDRRDLSRGCARRTSRRRSRRRALDGVLHYSRRSAATLLRLAGAAGALNALLSLAHYCLSAEVAAPLREAGAQRIAVAASPTESALLTLLK